MNGQTAEAEYLTTEQLATRLGVDKTTLDNWHALGIGPLAVKFDGGDRSPRHYPLGDVQAWQATIREEAAQARARRLRQRPGS